MDKSTRPVFILILIVGAILRIWGIGFGLPYQFHQDEPIVVNHALAYGTGDLNPHFFAIPPLTSYILFFIYIIYFILGKIFGLFTGVDAFALEFFKDPTIFYLLGRVFIGFIPGVLCIILTRALYKNAFSSDRGALFAAAVVSFSIINVVDSHYIYTDMLMLMFIIMSMIRMFKMYNSPSVKNYSIAAVCVGCAIGAKYNAALLIAPFFITHALICKGRILNKNLIIGSALIAATFFVLNPFSLIDLKFFIASLLKQGGAETFIGWTHHIKYSLYESIGAILLILGFCGLAVMAAKDAAKGAILVSFPVLFYLHIVFFGQPFPRYVIPLIPFLAVGSGYLLFEFILPVPVRNKALPTLSIACFLIFVPLIVKSAKAGSLLASRDIRPEAAEWINGNLKQDTRIAFDHSFFRSVTLQNKEQLMEKIQAGKGIYTKKAELMIKAQDDKKSYYTYFLDNHPYNKERFMSTVPAIPFDLELLKRIGVEYVVINYANRQKDTEGFYKKLKSESVLVASFSPYRYGNIRMSYDEAGTTCLPILSKELYDRTKAGPALEIYKLRR